MKNQSIATFTAPDGEKFTGDYKPETDSLTHPEYGELMCRWISDVDDDENPDGGYMAYSWVKPGKDQGYTSPCIKDSVSMETEESIWGGFISEMNEYWDVAIYGKTVPECPIGSIRELMGVSDDTFVDKEPEFQDNEGTFVVGYSLGEYFLVALGGMAFRIEIAEKKPIRLVVITDHPDISVTHVAAIRSNMLFILNLISW